MKGLGVWCSRSGLDWCSLWVGAALTPTHSSPTTVGYRPQATLLSLSLFFSSLAASPPLPPSPPSPALAPWPGNGRKLWTRREMGGAGECDLSPALVTQHRADVLFCRQGFLLRGGRHGVELGPTPASDATVVHAPLGLRTEPPGPTRVFWGHVECPRVCHPSPSMSAC